LSVLLTSCVVWLKFLEMRRFSSADLWSTKVSLLPLSFWVKRKRGQRTHRIPHTHEQTCVCGVAVGESSSPCGGFCWCLRFLCGSRTRFATARRSDLPSRKIHVCLLVCVCVCVYEWNDFFERRVFRVKKWFTLTQNKKTKPHVHAHTQQRAFASQSPPLGFLLRLSLRLGARAIAQKHSARCEKRREKRRTHTHTHT
jgi:hypothetical protein